ncbi:MAG: hypothetical protein FWG02_00690 [Holophagaceae bacterium]|nr:hypothetical protein [Holophagaceae bacterium]
MFLATLIQISSPVDIKIAVQNEVASRPVANANDLYKLLHQSVFGVGHIISSKESAREYLQSEMASLGPALPNELLYDDLGGGIARVNLRPFRDGNGSIEDLLVAMVETAKANKGTQKMMTERVNEACRILAKQKKKVLAKSLKSLAKKQASSGYPALHHSEAYRNAYLPAYRIVDRKFLPPMEEL